MAPAPSRNSRSMAGTSQTTPRRCASSDWAETRLPSTSMRRRSLSGKRQVVTSQGPSRPSSDTAIRHGPAVPPVELGQSSAAQAAAGRQQRERFEQVGLAGAIGAEQHDGPALAVEVEPAIVAKSKSCTRRTCATATLDRPGRGAARAAIVIRAWASARRACRHPPGRARPWAPRRWPSRGAPAGRRSRSGCPGCSGR